MDISSSHVFLGRGWGFPVRTGPRGGIAMVDGATEIAAAIGVILSTVPGERVMRPQFGCAIWDYVFDGTEPNTLGMIAQCVREALGQWEPRITLDEVAVTVHPQQANRVDIELDYTIKATNDRRNLVHPFYVIPRDEHGP